MTARQATGPGTRRPVADRPCIAHLTHSLGQGGVERGILNLATRLPGERFRQIVISLNEPSDLAPAIGADRVFRLGKRPGNDLAVVLRLAKVLRAEQVDLLHARGWATLLEGRLAAWLVPGCRMVYGYHGTTYEDLRRPRRRRLLAQRLLLPRMDALVAVSPSAARTWLSEVGLPGAPVQVIPDGVSLPTPAGPATRAALRRGLGIPGGFCLGTVGRLDPVKDQATLLRAFARLRLDGLPATLLLIGDGPERSRLEALTARLGLHGAVRFLGSRTDAPRLLPAMDLFVQSSLSEALPNALLEALAAGVPVVATAVGGTCDVLHDGETGALVPPGDPERLAADIGRLLGDPAGRERYAAAGRRLVRARYSLEAMLRAYAHLYDTLLPGRIPVATAASLQGGY
jgi:sugar transferase (PEP-CTERM/EpsH1 system associated)